MIGDFYHAKKFRFWSQKVLPLVYDDSLSYYEVLCKLVDFVNNLSEVVSETFTQIDATIKEYVETWLSSHPEIEVTIPDRSITTNKIANGAVTDVKLDPDLAITEYQINLLF